MLLRLAYPLHGVKVTELSTNKQHISLALPNLYSDTLVSAAAGSRYLESQFRYKYQHNLRAASQARPNLRSST
jgi:hypothetical protein